MGAGAEELCGKIRIKVHWESQSFARSPEDEPRFFLRDVFGHDDKVRAVVYVMSTICVFVGVVVLSALGDVCVRSFCVPGICFLVYACASVRACLHACLHAFSQQWMLHPMHAQPMPQLNKHSFLSHAVFSTMYVRTPAVFLSYDTWYLFSSFV